MKHNSLEAQTETELRKIYEHAYDHRDHTLAEAAFRIMVKKGWTNNDPSTRDQEIFNYYAALNKNMLAEARVAGKGRDLLLNSNNVDVVRQALSDASKEEIKNWGADETKILLQNARKALAFERKGGDVDAKIAQMEKDIQAGRPVDAAEYRQLKALKLVRSIEEGKMKRGYEQGGSAKSSLFTAAASTDPGLFNAGALAMINEQRMKAGVPTRTVSPEEIAREKAREGAVNEVITPEQRQASDEREQSVNFGRDEK